jgi:hypothetical protein
MFTLFIKRRKEGAFDRRSRCSPVSAAWAAAKFRTELLAFKTQQLDGRVNQALIHTPELCLMLRDNLLVTG